MNSDDPNYQNEHDPENNTYNSTYLQGKNTVSVPVVPPPPPQQRQMVNILFSIH